MTKETRAINKIREVIKGVEEHQKEMQKLVLKIQKNPSLLNVPNRLDIIKIYALSEKRRCAFIFCELVKKEYQANVYWRRPIPEEAITTALTRIKLQIQEKGFSLKTREIQLKNIEIILKKLQKWTTTPLILDIQERAQNDRRAWRIEMQKIFDEKTGKDSYIGPFTNFYHSNAIRANLSQVGELLYNLGKNFRLMGLPSNLEGKNGVIIDSALDAKKIVNYSDRVEKQKIIVDQVHTLIRHIFNTIGTDNL